ncbi:PAAR domain-containing protein [Fulvivirga sediminis]|uniref:PAAR domain-containing protein n=1 Tax=Fulvivirga sediminis TaxID=2803949 RepID=A0A937K2X6_9BACT|nr:PAAR domain-containing protein [Fulvivirga sediminis]MBL3659081.1 PAAR domain-containing protein [Fulvivirga sediminis]
MPGQAATINSMHICPMCTGTVPHVGGPISGPGQSNILINGKPAATQGDLCICSGPPDTIVQGHSAVMHNGKPAACVGDMTAHGGTITVGEPTVIHGFVSEPMKPSTMAVKKIPFPEITMTNRITGNAQEAIANQEEIKRQAEDMEGEPRIYNVQWVMGDLVIRDAQVYKEVTVRAYVSNIADGESITFSIKKAVETDNNEEATEEDIIELTGTVKDKMVEVTWEIEKAKDNENSDKSS